MSGGGTQKSLRKALGAIKDSTTVGLAKVNSDYKVRVVCSPWYNGCCRVGLLLTNTTAFLFNRN